MRRTHRMERVGIALVIASCAGAALYLGGCGQKSAEEWAWPEEPVIASAVPGQGVGEALMEEWSKEVPDGDWVSAEKERHTLRPGADNADVLEGEQAEGHAYGKYTEQDIIMWARETERFVVAGSRIFHDAKALGSTNGVSCDMCHPHAANTHPETYPKFQPQLGRSVLLRDMINWCIENPVRGKAFAGDDFRMRALEAYIFAQRRGVPLNYNKH